MTFLEKVRLVLAIAGLMFLLAGVAIESRIMVWVAIVLLGMAFIVRLYTRKKSSSLNNS